MSWTGNSIPHGLFTEQEWKDCDPEACCVKCRTEGEIQYKTWESSDGAYEDYLFRCVACGYQWWVDGDDG